MNCQSSDSISVERLTGPASTHWDDWNAQERQNWSKCLALVRICSVSDTLWMDCIPSWETQRLRVSTAIFLNFPTNKVILISPHKMSTVFDKNLVIRISEMDRIQWRQINASLFLRSEEFRLYQAVSTYPIQSCTRQHWKRHELDIREIHGTPIGNLFLFVHRIGWFSFFFVNWSLFKSRSLPQQSSDRLRSSGRGQHRQSTMESIDHPVDAEYENGRSSLAADCRQIFWRSDAVWQRRTVHSFHRMDVAGRYWITLTRDLHICTPIVCSTANTKHFQLFVHLLLWHYIVLLT